MKNKIMHIIVNIAGICVSLLLILWIILSYCLEMQAEFYQVSLVQWVPIFLGFEMAYLFSYFLTKKQHTIEGKIKIYEDIIVKMQSKLKEDPAQLFSYNFALSQTKGSTKLNHYSQQLLLYFRSLANTLSLLEKHKKDLKICDELNFIKDHLDEYKFQMTENIQDFQTLKEKRVYAKKEIDLIDFKLDEIRLKLYF